MPAGQRRYRHLRPWPRATGSGVEPRARATDQGGGWRVRRKVATLLCLALGAAAPQWTPLAGQPRVANTGGHQFNLQFLRPSGGPVVPFFEGWQPNPDGTYDLVFGYWNVNTEEVLDIPLGPNNFIEPREFDGMQPTHFLPVPEGDRRYWGVFAVTVPADFGTRDVVWTLRIDGEEFSVPGRLTSAPYQLDGWDQPGRLNVAPAIRFEEDGPPGIGFSGITAGPVDARAGVALRASVWTGRENPHREDDRPILVRWMKHQGPGQVRFGTTETEVEATGGEAANEVTFAEPGEYLLRVLAYNEISDFEFFCCWTNGYLRVHVAP